MHTSRILRRNLYSVPSKIKLITNKALCRPRMEVEVWESIANKHLLLLGMVQNKATRFIIRLTGRDGLKWLRLAPLQERRKMKRIKPLFSIMESRDPSFTEMTDFIVMCFKEDCPSTRATLKGQQLTIGSKRGAF